MRARYLFVRERSDQAFAQVLESLEPDVRDVVATGFLETRWYPFEMLVAFSEAIDRVLGQGDGALYFEMGKDSCERNLTTVHRLLFKFGNIAWLLDRVAEAWKLQYDEGAMSLVERKDRERVTLQLDGIAHPHRAQCLAITGWMVRAAELSGEDQFECSETCRVLGDERCQWSFVWPQAETKVPTVHTLSDAAV